MKKVLFALLPLLTIFASGALAQCPAPNVYPFAPNCPLPAASLNSALEGRQQRFIEGVGLADGTAAMQAGIDAAYTAGDIIVVGNGTYNVTGITFYTGQHVLFERDACVVMLANGPAIKTRPSPGAAPGLSDHVVIEDGCVRMNGKNGVGFLMEGSHYSHLLRPKFSGVPNGTFTYNDGVNTVGVYQNAGIMIKGVPPNVSGPSSTSAYSRIYAPQSDNGQALREVVSVSGNDVTLSSAANIGVGWSAGNRTNPDTVPLGTTVTNVVGDVVTLSNPVDTAKATNVVDDTMLFTQGGIGIWMGTSDGSDVQVGNSVEIFGGRVTGYRIGAQWHMGSDGAIRYTDLSQNIVGAQDGGNGGIRSVKRNVYEHLYLENMGKCGVYFTTDSNSTDNMPDQSSLLNGFASFANTIHPICNESPGVTTNPSAGFQLPNMLLNGGMDIDQVHEGASVSITTGVFTNIVDGWGAWWTGVTGGAFSAQRVLDGPTSSGEAHRYSLKMTSGAVGTPSVVSSKVGLYQKVLAEDVGKIGGFSASSDPGIRFCISMWVKASFAGRVAGFVSNDDGTNDLTIYQVWPIEIRDADTWQKSQYCLKDRVSGGWTVVGSAPAMHVGVMIAGFSRAHPYVWDTIAATGAMRGVLDQTNVFAETNGATFQLTGVQLTIGDQATRFYPRPASEELRLAQYRYRKTFLAGTAPAQNAGLVGALCKKGVSTTIGTLDAMWQFPSMRSTPTVTTYNPSAANTKWRDVTAAADIGVLVDPSTAIGDTGVQISSQTDAPTVANNYCIHATADARP